MIVNAVTFEFLRNIDFHCPFTLKAGGVAVNLTNKELYFCVRRRDESAPALALSTSAPATANGSAFTIVSAINGTLDLVIAKEDIALFNFASGNWWMTRQSPTEPETMIGRGTVVIDDP